MSRAAKKPRSTGSASTRTRERTVRARDLAPPIPRSLLDPLVAAALAEDVGSGDVTTELTVPATAMVRGRIVAKAPLVLAGTFVADRVFALVDPRISLRWRAADGDEVAPGTVVAELAGPARGVLVGERLALNFLQRLSGIATQTRAYVRAVTGTKARVVDTRKTTPGLRTLEKWAVRAGGGGNHRTGLSDGILIKDNHIAAAGGITAAVRAAKEGAPHTLLVEVEVEDLRGLDEALRAGADAVLLDNFAESDWAAAVARVDGRARVEISGNMDVRRARLAALAGADIISVGALTHSVTAADLSLRLDRLRRRA